MKQQQILLQFSGSNPSEFWPKPGHNAPLTSIKNAKRFTSVDEALRFAAKENAQFKRDGHSYTLQVVTINN